MLRQSPSNINTFMFRLHHWDQGFSQNLIISMSLDLIPVGPSNSLLILLHSLLILFHFLMILHPPPPLGVIPFSTLLILLYSLLILLHVFLVILLNFLLILLHPVLIPFRSLLILLPFQQISASTCCFYSLVVDPRQSLPPFLPDPLSPPC